MVVRNILNSNCEESIRKKVFYCNAACVYILTQNMDIYCGFHRRRKKYAGIGGRIEKKDSKGVHKSKKRDIHINTICREIEEELGISNSNFLRKYLREAKWMHIKNDKNNTVHIAVITIPDKSLLPVGNIIGGDNEITHTKWESIYSIINNKSCEYAAYFKNVLGSYKFLKLL